MDYEDRTHRYERQYDKAGDTMSRFGRWLSKRPSESWMFFFAGLFIAGLLF